MSASEAPDQLVIENREKRSAALSSVIAAIALTCFKIVVGVMTNSLGILAEAAHSGLDLLAALVTLFAVRVSGKPADDDHLYGHGKIENLSALFETLLLLSTSGWIIYEAINRLFFRSVEVIPSLWGFVVMGISIWVDTTRSRILYRAARKYRSQALEADALHFRTDIWSSSVVILGLIGVFVARRFPRLEVLAQADGVAALIVAIIVVYVSAELGVRSTQGLLDHAPPGLDARIKRVVEEIPGIIDCHNIRVRTSGSRTFVDVHITLSARQTLRSAHDLTEQVEQAVQAIQSNADVTVHAEPQPAAGV
jgi:cation diffusion facilitator family transporter